MFLNHFPCYSLPFTYLPNAHNTHQSIFGVCGYGLRAEHIVSGKLSYHHYFILSFLPTGSLLAIDLEWNYDLIRTPSHNQESSHHFIDVEDIY